MTGNWKDGAKWALLCSPVSKGSSIKTFPFSNDWPEKHLLFMTTKTNTEWRWYFKLFCCFNRLGRVNSESLLFKKQLFTDSSCILWGCDTVAFCSGVCENFIVIPSLEAEEDLILLNIKRSHKKGHMKENRVRMDFFQGPAVMRLSKQ